MKKTKSTLVAFILGALSVVLSVALINHSNGTINSILSPDKTPVFHAKYDVGSVGNPTDPAVVGFQSAAEASVPSVVHIKTITKVNRVSGRQAPNMGPFGDFFGNDDMLRRFFGDGGGNFSIPDQRASGSGVIISSDGYIVTNNHVVNGATDITVTLNDRKNYKAKVVGSDPNTDLALIKIDAKNLPVMPVGNSDEARLGQWVLAVGYPLNLDVTVTQGIISAKSRNIGINRQGNAPVESFIQTDAAVNPGSSGGALVNTQGELIGINSAIASQTGSFAGYAYAIPSNLMKKVIGDIMKYGTVQRGYLGISMAPDELDDSAKKELGINDNISGVWIAETDPQGAAAEAGLKKGDAIIKINGNAVSTNAQLSEEIARMKPGDKVNVTYMRNGGEKSTTVTLKGKLGTFASQGAAALESLGASFKTLDKDQLRKLGINGGVQISNINDNGVIGSQTNIREGFVITKVGGIAVNSVDDLKSAISKQGNNFQIEGIYPGSRDIYYYGINGFRQ